MSTGGTALNRINKTPPTGPPFVPTSADNGVSVDPISMRIVFGNDVGGTAADLLSVRQVNMKQFGVDFTSVLGGAQAATSLQLDASLNTTGVYKGIVELVSNTASAAGSKLLFLQETKPVPGLGALLDIPLGGAQMTFDPNGIRLLGVGTGAGGIALNGSPVSPNTLHFSPGMEFEMTTGLTPINTDAMRFLAGSGNNINPASGIMALFRFSGAFAPLGGTAECSAISVTTIFDNTLGGTGITRGLYINPTVIAAADFRAIEVMTGRSIFRDTISADDGTLPNGPGAWLTGTVVAAVSVLDATRYVEVKINGAVVKLAVIA